MKESGTSREFCSWRWVRTLLIKHYLECSATWAGCHHCWMTDAIFLPQGANRNGFRSTLSFRRPVEEERTGKQLVVTSCRRVVRKQVKVQRLIRLISARGMLARPLLIRTTYLRGKTGRIVEMWSTAVARIMVDQAAHSQRHQIRKASSEHLLYHHQYIANILICVYKLIFIQSGIGIFMC